MHQTGIPMQISSKEFITASLLCECLLHRRE